MNPDPESSFQERHRETREPERPPKHPTERDPGKQNRKKKTQIIKNGKMAPKARSREAIIASLTKYFKHDSFKSDLQRRAVEAVVQGEATSSRE